MAPTSKGSRDDKGSWAHGWLVNALGLYVLVMYGVTYYALSTAAPRIAQEFGVSASLIFGVFSLALLLAAALARRWGRWVDNAGAAKPLLFGAILRAVAVAAMAIAPEIWSFLLALIAVQLLGQLTEYDASFAAAVETSGPRARADMSQITLWGGVASTTFWPVTALLLDQTGWRSMFLIYAGVMLAVCVPIAALWVRLPRGSRESHHPIDGEMPNEAPPSARPLGVDAQFVLLAAAFAFAGVAFNLPVLMLPVLEGVGLGAGAVVVGMVFGPSQTAGRLFELLFGQRLHALGVAVMAAAGVVLSLILLLLHAGLWSAIIFAVVFGAGVGVGYVVRGSVVLALYGKADYASWLGRLATVRLMVSAISPFILSLILEQHGAQAVIAFCAAMAALSFICFIVLERRRRAGLVARLAT